MTNPWDSFEPPAGNGFKSLARDGDEIIGTIVRIGKHDPFGEGVVPRVYLTEDGEEFHYDATLSWIRNALLRERPEVGTRIRMWRGPKQGKQVTGGLEILTPGAGLAKVKPRAEAERPGQRDAGDDLPPF